MEELRKIPVFASLSDDDLKEISALMSAQAFKKKMEIFSEGDNPDWFYILLEGKVKITKLSQDGREIILEVISPGEFFGGFAVIKGFPYPANAVTMEKSRILKLSRRDIMKIIEKFPGVMYAITSNLGDRTREMHDTMKNIALERVDSRIASLLLKLAERTVEKEDIGKPGEAMQIDMKLTKQDIAEMVGTTVETAIRVMSRFRKAGFLADDSGRIIIKKPAALRNIVSPDY